MIQGIPQIILQTLIHPPPPQQSQPGKSPDAYLGTGSSSILSLHFERVHSDAVYT